MVHKYKMDFVFIVAEPGEKIGRLIRSDTLKEAKRKHKQFLYHDYVVSKIGKMKKR